MVRSSVVAVRGPADSDLDEADPTMSLERRLERLCAWAGRGAEAPTGLRTGFGGFDARIGGLRPGLTVLAGRPANGKTALALNIVHRVACGDGHPVVFFNLESSNDAAARRLLGIHTGVDPRFPAPGMGRPERKSVEALGKAPIYLEGCPRPGFDAFLDSVRWYREARGVRLVVVDEFRLLLDLMDTPSLGYREELAEAGRRLRALGRELRIPVLVTCRLAQADEDCSPCLPPRYADLRRAGFIGADGDVAILVHRPGIYLDPPDLSLPVKLIIARTRCGPETELYMDFRYKCLRFEDKSNPAGGVGSPPPPHRPVNPRERQERASRGSPGARHRPTGRGQGRQAGQGSKEPTGGRRGRRHTHGG